MVQTIPMMQKKVEYTECQMIQNAEIPKTK